MGIDQPIDITTEQRKAVLALLRRHLPGTAAWVYGSRAKWTSRLQSDLDLVVFATSEQQRQVGDLREAFEESNLPFRVDLFVWDDVPESFRKQIEAEHVVLVEGHERNSTVGGPSGCLHDEWTQHRMVDLCDITRGASPRPIHDWIATSGIPWVKIADASATASRYIEQTHECIRCEGRPKSVTVVPGDLILSNSASPGIPKFMNIEACIHDGWLLLRNFRGLDRLFTYYLLLHERDALVGKGTGSVFTNLKTETLKQHSVTVPTLNDQRAIAHILGALDDKIELNRRMNATLEALARALFKSWFVDFDPVRAKMKGRDTGLPSDIADLFPDRLVDSAIGRIPEGWRLRPLDSIACFQNGLALQKFRPAANEAHLPVVKIAQLRAGEANSGEWASSTIKPACIIENGDVVFSWSGSLLVETWCGGRAALNQHLFKVTSEEYPKWFYLHSILSHFPDFQRIAKDKTTTMGHIRRHHLTDALCVVPPRGMITRVSEMLGGLLERRIANEVSGRTLATLRDVLLPVLISGELPARNLR